MLRCRLNRWDQDIEKRSNCSCFLQYRIFIKVLKISDDYKCSLCDYVWKPNWHTFGTQIKIVCSFRPHSIWSFLLWIVILLTTLLNTICSIPDCPENCDVCEYDDAKALSTCATHKCSSSYVWKPDKTCIGEASVIVQWLIKHMYVGTHACPSIYLAPRIVSNIATLRQLQNGTRRTVP